MLDARSTAAAAHEKIGKKIPQKIHLILEIFRFYGLLFQ